MSVAKSLPRLGIKRHKSATIFHMTHPLCDARRKVCPNNCDVILTCRRVGVFAVVGDGVVQMVPRFTSRGSQLQAKDMREEEEGVV